MLRETLIDALSKDKASSFQKYRELYVGETNIWGFIQYELLTLFLSSMPGALGFFLRKIFYKKLFAAFGKSVIIGPRVTIRCPGHITLGNKIFIDDGTVLDAKGHESRIQTGDSILIGNGSILSCASSTIQLGDDISIGSQCLIRAGMSPVQIGSQVTVGAQSVIISGTPAYDRMDVPMKTQVGSSKGVRIGDDVWIGVGARIIDGVTIGTGCVIGAGSVVTKNIPDYIIAAGVPAKTIGNRNRHLSEA
ncbi:MAG: acyltransferase [Planctomycetota bacterium]|jgi:acetyltransferase-like isoleucine patch superfamily enzyme